MKKRLCVAIAGAVLAAGTFGGVGFAASNGRDSTRTNISSHNPADAARAVQCANLQLDIVQLQLRIASAKNFHQARALAKHVAQLRQQFARECG